MSETVHLALPYIAAAQAQKHVTHNEALRILDALVMLAVKDRDLSAPPGALEDGDRYLVKPTGTGAFAGKDDQIAHYRDGAWSFHAPKAGWLCYVADEDAVIAFDGAQWNLLLGENLYQNIAQLGVGTTADATNPFSAKLNKALWTARYDGEGGDGDLRYTLNKQAAANVLSLLLQSDWSGRAEIGLLGNDDLSVKVSADGANWKEALVADRSTGRVQFPQGIVHPATGLEAPLYVPAPAADIWRLEASRGGTPRTYTIDSVSGANVTLTTASVAQIFGSYMRNQSAVRVWNISKDPAQSAWVDWDHSTTQFRVTNAADVAGWTNGETIRLGDPDPTGDNTLQMVAVDISGYLQNSLGAVFPQKGLLLSLYVSSSDGPATLNFSPSGAIGTAAGGNALSDGVRNQISMPIPSSVPSPISNSNLFFVREQLQFGATDITTAFARVLGVYV